VIRYNYNRQLDPPGPFIHVHLKSPDGSRELRDVPAQMDTGADLTVIPESAVLELQLVAAEVVTVIALGNQKSAAMTYYLQAAPRECKSVFIEVIADHDEPNVLLGRNFLNHFHIVLNGPELVLELS
jgi:predicted aspartyl protease